MAIIVENYKKYSGPGIKIMRGTALGNPFVIGRDGNRSEAIAKYKRWLWREWNAGSPPVVYALEFIRDAAKSGDNVHLICCCKPLPCHGDVVKAMVEWMIREGH